MEEYLQCKKLHLQVDETFMQRVKISNVNKLPFRVIIPTQVSLHAAAFKLPITSEINKFDETQPPA